MSKISLHGVVAGTVWLAVALMLAGCAGPWKAAPDQFHVSRWSITSPEGWMHLNTAESDLFSKNGPYLEYILIQSRPLSKGFHYTRQKLTADMLPHEAARLITDNMRSDPLLRRFRLLSSAPAMVGGHLGFKLVYSYQDRNGVEMKTIHYGALLSGTYFNLRYTAAQRHYFDSELPTFNRVFDSLRFVSDGPGLHVSTAAPGRRSAG